MQVKSLLQQKQKLCQTVLDFFHMHSFFLFSLLLRPPLKHENTSNHQTSAGLQQQQQQQQKQPLPLSKRIRQHIPDIVCCVGDTVWEMGGGW